MARPDQDAPGRLLEVVSDHDPREMTVRTATSDRTRLTGRPRSLHSSSCAASYGELCRIWKRGLARADMRAGTHLFRNAHRSIMRQRFAAVRNWSSGLVALVAYACSSGGVAPPRTATPPSPRDSASTAASHEWLVRRDTGRWRYRVQTDARVTLTADTTAPTAPIRSIAI